MNLFDYINVHKEDLKPPVCNKMIHNDGKLRVMIIGGPNLRKDYHMNMGEEIFYQIKGDMCLKVMENNEPRDVIIREGEFFILPGKIPHSPQRFENTMGLVIERMRPEGELDGLRYFTDDTNKEVLWQRFFHVTDLGQQLVPLIEDFFASEEFKTRVPIIPMRGKINKDNKRVQCTTRLLRRGAVKGRCSSIRGSLRLLFGPLKTVTLLFSATRRTEHASACCSEHHEDSTSCVDSEVREPTVRQKGVVRAECSPIRRAGALEDVQPTFRFNRKWRGHRFSPHQVDDELLVP